MKRLSLAFSAQKPKYAIGRKANRKIALLNSTRIASQKRDESMGGPPDAERRPMMILAVEGKFGTRKVLIRVGFQHRVQVEDGNPPPLQFVFEALQIVSGRLHCGAVEERSVDRVAVRQENHMHLYPLF